MINPTKRSCQGDWGQENHSVPKVLPFLHFEVKEAVEVIEAFGVIMADGAKEAADVLKFT